MSPVGGKWAARKRYYTSYNRCCQGVLGIREVTFTVAGRCAEEARANAYDLCASLGYVVLEVRMVMWPE